MRKTVILTLELFTINDIIIIEVGKKEKRPLRLLAQIIGVLAVALFLLSYQQKKRKNIIITNAISRILYIIQYIMLGAFSGAALDVVGTVSSVAAGKKNTAFIKKHIKTAVVLMNILIITVGLLLYENIVSLLPVFGVLLHTGAFWLDREKTVRRLSLLGSPFWLAYNLISGAYGSAAGDVLSIISIAVAIYRYDVRKEKKEEKV